MKSTKVLTSATALLVLTIFLQSFSFLSIKYATLNVGILSLSLLFMGFFFIGLRAIFWQHLLKLVDLSSVYPYAAFVQVLILLYAVVLFDEAITLNNLAGLAIMLAGIFFISR